MVKPTWNIRVIDIYNGDDLEAKDFKTIAADGIIGVIHKATQGTTFKDKSYKERKKMALDAGLLWGAYHFASDQKASEQLDHFLNVVGDDKDMLYALDYEPNKNNTMTLAQAKVFMQGMDKATGRLGVLYSGNLIKETLSAPDAFWNKHRLWLAQYSKSFKCPPGWDKPWLWQKTGDAIGPKPHTLIGLKNILDLNYWSDTDEELRKQWSGEPITLGRVKKKT